MRVLVFQCGKETESGLFTSLRRRKPSYTLHNNLMQNCICIDKVIAFESFFFKVLFHFYFHTNEYMSLLKEY